MIVQRSFMLLLLIATSIPQMRAQWIQTNGPGGGYVACFAFTPNGTRGTCLFAGTGSGVFLSTNNGTDWTAVNTGLPPYGYITALAALDTTLVAATGGGGPFGGGEFISTNNGATWVGAGLLNSIVVHSLAFSGADLLAGTYYSGVFRLNPQFPGWESLGREVASTDVLALAVSDTNLLAGTDSGVFLSSDNGTRWISVNTGLTNTKIHALAVSPSGKAGTNLWAGTEGGVFFSTNDGQGWVSAGLTNTAVSSLALSDTLLFAGTFGSGVFLSTNNGTSWTAVNTGLDSTDVWSLVVLGEDLFAGTYGGGVWRRPLSEMMTSAKMTSIRSSSSFNLKQNYPNPFNPSTTIEFTLPTRAFVSLKVFDALGREVAILLSKELNAGTHSRQWNAEGYASGMYLYRLQTESYTQTRKVLLLR